MKIFILVMTLFLNLNFWAQAIELPREMQRSMEQRILSDLKIREKRLGCHVADIKTTFSKVRVNSRKEHMAEYQVDFRELCAKGISTQFSVKKKVIFGKRGAILSLSPVEQELKF
ncbi:MAG TPA: hypothetical protein VIG33_10345 [Pseudobdellovibrionaceae bacterium]